MSVNAIEKRQNEERMLRYQYASRRYYNLAEKLNNLVWMCCIISWLTIFLPDSSSWDAYIIAVPFFADIIAAILNWRMTVYVSSAAALRKYFDAYVLGINIDQFTESDIQELEELTIRAVNHCPEKSKEQMANTGRDDPPGVRRWYELSQILSEQEAIYECQKQNCWWNKKITRKRLIYIGIELLILIPLVIFFIIEVQSKTGVLQVIFSSGGLIAKCAERLVTNVRYYIISLKIDGALVVLSNSRSDESIKNLQALIDTRRSMAVLERNHIHKRHAKEYSELYHDITTVQK